MTHWTDPSTRPDDAQVTVSPLPAHGTVLVGRDRVGRSLRVSAHPAAGRVVLSIWQDQTCVATVRLAEDDVPDLVAALTAGLARPPVVDDEDAEAG
jgi:TctA family transporter